ncbi:hypothetical protein OY671_010162, partial [Metschnikowia pulcherrima]
MRVFDREQRCFRSFADIWGGFDAPASPTGGSMIDVEARAFIADSVQSSAMASSASATPALARDKSWSVEGDAGASIVAAIY